MYLTLYGLLFRLLFLQFKIGKDKYLVPDHGY